MTHHLKNIILAGAAPDTGNHGVTALTLSTLKGLAERGVKEATVLDNGHGIGFGETLSLKYKSMALKPGKRIYQPNNMHQVRLRQMVGLPSPVISAFKNADAVLDVSGGDSFTDMYGPARFEQIVLPKLMALDTGTPLILLPQTYGPFRFKKTRKTATRIIKAAHLVYARDADSFNNLKTLLGDDFNPYKHRLGVDLAFGLPCIPKTKSLKTRPVGINVSGLLWHNVEEAKNQFGLLTDYRQCLLDFAMHILLTTDKHILLVPHVRPSGGSECDLVASRALKSTIPQAYRNRIIIEESANSPEMLKGVIAETCWFTGSRMHATIAALSTSTPVSNLAYSMKAKGVFASYALDDQVFDLRDLSTSDITNRLIKSFQNRKQLRKRLTNAQPKAKAQWAKQMDIISNALQMPDHTRSFSYA